MQTSPLAAICFVIFLAAIATVCLCGYCAIHAILAQYAPETATRLEKIFEEK